MCTGLRLLVGVSWLILYHVFTRWTLFSCSNYIVRNNGTGYTFVTYCRFLLCKFNIVCDHYHIVNHIVLVSDVVEKNVDSSSKSNPLRRRGKNYDAST